MFSIEKAGDIAIIIPSPTAEKMAEDLMLTATDLVLDPLDKMKPSGLVFDLSEVDYVGSLFLGFLLRCHKRAKNASSKLPSKGMNFLITPPADKTCEAMWFISAVDSH